MIDPISVYEIMCTIITIDSDKEKKAKEICTAVTEEINSKLKPNSQTAFGAISFSCAAISVYRFILLQNLLDDSYESVATGDVTVKRSYSSVLSSAEKLYKDASLTLAPYLTDVDFAFRTV